MTRIYDRDGQEQDAAWLAENCGAVFTQGHSDKQQVAELREAEGNALTVTAKPGTLVNCFFFGYRTGMNSGHTGTDGKVIFSLPLNFTYKLAGPSTLTQCVPWLRVIGLGVPEGTPNWRHLNVVFKEK